VSLDERGRRTRRDQRIRDQTRWIKLTPQGSSESDINYSAVPNSQVGSSTRQNYRSDTVVEERGYMCWNRSAIEVQTDHQVGPEMVSQIPWAHLQIRRFGYYQIHWRHRNQQTSGILYAGRDRSRGRANSELVDGVNLAERHLWSQLNQRVYDA